VSKRPLAWWLAAGSLIVLAAVTAPSRAAAPKAAPVKPAAAAPAPPAPAKPGDAAKAQAEAQQKEGQQTVETILRQQEDLLAGRQFSYDPAGRRDPFRSLFEEVAIRHKGPRPRGAGGMLVAELELTGIVRDTQGGNIAVVMGTDSKGYFLHVGDEVYDGSVIAIDPAAGTVSFRQQVDDPRLIKPYRDVVKRLVPQGEEKANE
jgi:hypothetical protein